MENFNFNWNSILIVLAFFAGLMLLRYLFMFLFPKKTQAQLEIERDVQQRLADYFFSKKEVVNPDQQNLEHVDLKHFRGWRYDNYRKEQKRKQEEIGSQKFSHATT